MPGDDGTDATAAAPLALHGRVAARGLLEAVDGGVAANRLAASGTSSLLRATARAAERGLDATPAGPVTGHRVDGVRAAVAGAIVGGLDAAAGDVSRLAARTDQSLGVVRTVTHASTAAVVGPIAARQGEADAVEIEL